MYKDLVHENLLGMITPQTIYSQITLADRSLETLLGAGHEQHLSYVTNRCQRAIQ